MLDKLNSALGYKSEALNLRAERQKVLANNIANADTPNFKARDIDFSKELDRVMRQGRSSGSGLSMATTSERHLKGNIKSSSVHDLLYRVPDQPSADGNTVDMDRERSQFTDNAVRYQANLTLMNSSIQRLKSAMQPE